MRDNIVCGLDMGSTATRIVIGQKKSTDFGEKFQIIGAVEVATQGISKGSVNGIEDATSTISSCIEKAERLVGIPVASAWIGINFPNIKCERSRGVVAVGKSDGEITEEDVERAIEAARALSVPPNYEILHVIPIRFSIDNQEDIKDPVGMTGVRLEVETLIIQALSSQIKNLTKAVYRSGMEIEDLVLAPLAAAEAVITAKQKELGAAVVNIGASTTGLAVFEEGELLHSAILPIGSEHITADIAIGLRCPIGLAERIKIEYGSAKPDLFAKKDEIDISSILSQEGITDEDPIISRKYVAEIIEARIEEIFEKVDNELKKIDRSGMLPAGVFLVGGGAKLANLVEAAKNQLRLPVALGSNKAAAVVIDKVDDLSYLNALGLCLWGNYAHQEISGRSGKGINIGQTLNRGVNKIKDIFKNFMP